MLTLNLRSAVTGVSPLLDRILPDLGMSTRVAGLLGSLPAFCFALAGLTGPRLLRLISAERAVLLALAAAAVGQALRPWSGGAVGFLAGTVLALLGMGLGNVVLPVVAKTWFPRRIGPVTMVYVTGITVATALPSLIAVLIADAVRTASGSTTTGWQVALVWWAALAAVAALPWCWIAQHPKASRPFATVAPAVVRPRFPL